MSDLLQQLVEALRAGSLRVVDLTQPLGPETPLLPLPPQWASSPPFSLRELSARVRAVLRRTTKPEDRRPSAYHGTRLSADFEAVAVTVEGHPVRLTRREFELLRYLVQNKNRVISRDRLLERVWGYERLVETRSVDVHVGRLRGKLGGAGRQIETVVGLGYRFVD